MAARLDVTLVRRALEGPAVDLAGDPGGGDRLPLPGLHVGLDEQRPHPLVLDAEQVADALEGDRGLVGDGAELPRHHLQVVQGAGDVLGGPGLVRTVEHGRGEDARRSLLCSGRSEAFSAMTSKSSGQRGS